MTRLQWQLAITALAAALCGWLLAGGAQAFFQSFLLGFLFWLDLSLGALAVLMLWSLTGGEWGMALRMPLAAAARLMPLHALLFVLLLPGLAGLYRWWPDAGALPALAAKGWWLSRGFFLLRAALYFALWVLLAWRWRRAWRLADAHAAPRMRRWSAAGLVVYGFTTWLAGVDWIMSLEPAWVSSGFGLLYGTVQMLGALAFGICVCAWREPVPAARTSVDLGNLLLTFLMMWMYLAFTQLLIIWAEDLPREILWYLPRLQTSWAALVVFLLVAQFVVPFALLLSRRLKQQPRQLGMLAGAVLAGQLLYTFLLVMPSLRPRGFDLRWSDALLVLAIGALCGVAWLHDRPARGVAHG